MAPLLKIQPIILWPWMKATILANKSELREKYNYELNYNLKLRQSTGNYFCQIPTGATEHSLKWMVRPIHHFGFGNEFEVGWGWGQNGGFGTGRGQRRCIKWNRGGRMPELMKDTHLIIILITNHELASLPYHKVSILQSAPIGDKALSKNIMDETWDGLALKGRMRQITTINLGRYLPNDYEQALAILGSEIYFVGLSTQGLMTMLFNLLPGFCLKFMGRMSAIGICQLLH